MTDAPTPAWNSEVQEKRRWVSGPQRASRPALRRTTSCSRSDKENFDEMGHS
jgi:hypothetical protein